ncbi:uncharacterized protein LOC119833350 [Zerene cesonia]|uniref:uncharacterized protein LOC119833350 n=1 Tax=Zerene cesonia TaxID=33412 RepID=UPI0018E541AE|nr:uncharacterized protein LOC119833350 [Zerene cesonia]
MDVHYEGIFVYVLDAESGHITLQCDEILIESQVEWYKDGCRLNSTFRNNLGSTEDEPHIAIDSRNSLYILHASKREEGTYVCFIDGERKQSYKIKVVSMSRLLNQEFFRYSMYLAFVLSLTLVCYCTGIVVAWHRRTSFLDPIFMNLILCNLIQQIQQQ